MKREIEIIVPSPVKGLLQASAPFKLSIDDEQFSSIEVALQPNYYDGFGRRTSKIVRTGIVEYLKPSGARMYRNLMCVETPLPNRLGECIELRMASCGKPGSRALALFHAGHAGAIAPLHFDWDHRWVLHACLKGRKTVYLFPPSSGWLLNPIVNTSSIDVPRLSTIDRNDLLRRLEGLEVHLKSGQAVLFPSLWWHALRYHQSSTSLSIRFGEKPRLRPFAVLPRSFWLQRLVWEFFQDDTLDPTPYLRRCLNTFFQKQTRWSSRYERVTNVYRECLLELGQSSGSEYLASSAFNAELILAAAELRAAYTLGKSQRTTQAVELTRKFVFEQTASVPYKMQLNVAQYARIKRQGLPVQRGLVAVNP